MCGIVGIVSTKPVAMELFDSLIQLQHRGQAAAGIITIDQKLNMKLGKGLVREVFQQSDMEALTGNMGIAHVRYPTAGDSGSLAETQPFWLGFPYGMAMAHNGNLINYDELKKLLQTQFRRHLNTSSDSEALIHLISAFLEETEKKNPSNDFFAHACDAIQKVFENAKGSYSTICAIANKGILAFRDPHGVRPLMMARRFDQDYIIASENTPFFSLGFKMLADIQPGELVFIDLEGNLQRKQLMNKDFHPCIFEYVYFARPDAVLDDVSVYQVRLNLGTRLAKAWREKYPDLMPDVIVPVPFTSNTAALSFAREINVPYSEGLYKNPFIGRTFIMPNQQMRRYSVRHKLSPQWGEIHNKNVLLLDDSIVRGTTSKEIVRMVREMGAKKVYLVSTAPAIQSPCYYGIDIPTTDELIANRMTVAELQEYLDVDVLLYQTEKDLVEAVTENKPHMKSPCMGCMNKQYLCGTPASTPIVTTKHPQKRIPVGCAQITKNILLIGGGAREHAIARALKKSTQNTALFYCAPHKNPGIDLLSQKCCVVNLTDHKTIVAFAKEHNIDFAIIGPEAPLAAGLVDDLQAVKIPCIGPTKLLAQIESSKGFARDLMREYDIDGSPHYQNFSDYNSQTIQNFIKTLDNQYVIKADGLCGGKGVKVSGEHLHSIDDALQFCRDINGPFVIEEKCVGVEFSLISFTDGESVQHFPPVQDHKRAFENDIGPNTGGMGSYSLENHLLPFLSQKDVKTAEAINEKIVKALQDKYQQPYIGFIYGGFMITKNGVRVIEFNSRLGDPEAINLLSILKTDFLQLCQHALSKKLSALKLICEQAATVVKYIVPNGYPEKSLSAEIKINHITDQHYFGSVTSVDNNLMMTGSRAIAVLGVGKTVIDAEKQAEKLASDIQGPVFYRKDIGTSLLIDRYVRIKSECV